MVIDHTHAQFSEFGFENFYALHGLCLLVFECAVSCRDKFVGSSKCCFCIFPYFEHFGTKDTCENSRQYIGSVCMAVACFPFCIDSDFITHCPNPCQCLRLEPAKALAS